MLQLCRGLQDFKEVSGDPAQLGLRGWGGGEVKGSLGFRVRGGGGGGEGAYKGGKGGYKGGGGGDLKPLISHPLTETCLQATK